MFAPLYSNGIERWNLTKILNKAENDLRPFNASFTRTFVSLKVIRKIIAGQASIFAIS